MIATLLGPIGELGAQTIRGKLLEFGSDEPIELGLVFMLSADGDSVASTLTDTRGYFEIEARRGGSYLLEAAALGYRESRVGIFDLGRGGEMSVEFRLWPAPLTIDGIIVESLVQEPELVRNGFYRRLQRGVGTFFSPADIEEEPNRRTAELFLGLAGVRTVLGSARGERLMIRGSSGYCQPTVFIDGVRATWSGTSMALDQLIPFETVYAAEVHRGVSGIPIEFGSFNSCGLLVFWTKRARGRNVRRR